MDDFVLAGKTVGTNIQLWTCTEGDNQKWLFNDTDGTIRGVQSGLCMDVGSTANCSVSPFKDYPYCNYKLDALTRAKDLVSRLTLADKV